MDTIQSTYQHAVCSSVIFNRFLLEAAKQHDTCYPPATRAPPPIDTTATHLHENLLSPHTSNRASKQTAHALSSSPQIVADSDQQQHSPWPTASTKHTRPRCGGVMLFSSRSPRKRPPSFTRPSSNWMHRRRYVFAWTDQEPSACGSSRACLKFPPHASPTVNNAKNKHPTRIFPKTLYCVSCVVHQ